MGATQKELRQKIAIGLASGVKPSALAEELSISPSYISQLQNDTGFKLLLAKCMGDVAGIATAKNALIDSVEERLLMIVDANLPTFCKSTNDVIKLFKMANEAKRDPIIKDEQKAEVVVVQLPTFITNNTINIDHKVNDNNEIIGIGGRDLISLDSEALKKAAENPDLLEGTIEDLSTSEIPEVKEF